MYEKIGRKLIQHVSYAPTAQLFSEFLNEGLSSFRMPTELMLAGHTHNPYPILFTPAAASLVSADRAGSGHAGHPADNQVLTQQTNVQRSRDGPAPTALRTRQLSRGGGTGGGQHLLKRRGEK